MRQTPAEVCGVCSLRKMAANAPHPWFRFTPCETLLILRGYTAMKFKVFLAAVVITALSIPSSQASSTGWRYWGYFQAAPGASTWTPAMTGPTVNVADGSVEGWAFTFSNDAIPDAKSPKRAPSFSKICAKTKAVTGKKRIAVMIDFGSAVLRPKGESTPRLVQRCVVADKDALGIDVLGQVAKVRAQGSGFICGLNGYPAKECGVEMKTPKAYLKK